MGTRCDFLGSLADSAPSGQRILSSLRRWRKKIAAVRIVPLNAKWPSHEISSNVCSFFAFLFPCTSFGWIKRLTCASAVNIIWYLSEFLGSKVLWSVRVFLDVSDGTDISISPTFSWNYRQTDHVNVKLDCPYPAPLSKKKSNNVISNQIRFGYKRKQKAGANTNWFQLNCWEQISQGQTV